MLVVGLGVFGVFAFLAAKRPLGWLLVAVLLAALLRIDGFRIAGAIAKEARIETLDIVEYRAAPDKPGHREIAGIDTAGDEFGIGEVTD